MRVTHAGIYLQQLVMAYSIYKISSHGIFTLILVVNIRVI